MMIGITPNTQEELDEIRTRLGHHGFRGSDTVRLGGLYDTYAVWPERKEWFCTFVATEDATPPTTIEQFRKMFPLPEDGPTLKTIAKEVEIVRGDEIFRLSMGHDNFSISASWVDSPDKSDYVELPMEVFDDIINILNDLKGEIYGTNK